MSGIKRNYFDLDDIEDWQKYTAQRFGHLVSAVGGRTNACKIISNVTPDTISNWSTGKSKVPLYAACLLCQEAGKSINWLITGLEDSHYKEGDPSDNIYEIVHGLLVLHLEEKGISHITYATVAKLSSYLTKRIQQRIQEETGYNLNDISLDDFHDEVVLVIGQ